MSEDATRNACTVPRHAAARGVSPVSFVLLALAARGQAAELEPEIRKALPDHGLVVVAGAKDAGPALAAVQDRPILSQVLAAGEPLSLARRQIAAEGRSGQVSAQEWTAGDPLPYGKWMVNLLAIDADALGGKTPDEAEIRRVLPPGGVALIREKGAWRRLVQVRPEGLAGWTHWNADPQASGRSRDAVVGPPDAFRFIVSENAMDLRVSQGVLVSLQGSRQPVKAPYPTGVIARDAFNGLPRWSAPKITERNNLELESLAADDRRVVLFPDYPDGPAAAFDLATGKPLARFTQGIAIEKNVSKTFGVDSRPYAFQVLEAGVLYQAFRESLIALNASTGEPLWRFTAPGKIARLAVDAGRCFVTLTRNADFITGARWRTVMGADTVMAVKDGKELWIAKDLEVTRSNDLQYVDQTLYLYVSATNMEPPEPPSKDAGGAEHSGKKNNPIPRVIRLDAKTGKVLWRQAGAITNVGFHNNAIVRPDGLWMNLGSSWKHYEAQNGNQTIPPTIAINYRCVRGSGAGDWIVQGFNLWVDGQGNSWQTPLGRGDCARPVYLAEGGAFNGHGVVCTCLLQCGGLLAFHQDPAPAPLPDDKRLDKAPRVAPSAPAPDKEPPPLLAQEWVPNPHTTVWVFRESAMEAGGYRLRLNIDRHRLVAERNGAEAWRFVGDSRLYALPLVIGDACYVPSADGTVTCLTLANGAPRWRFLAAPERRQMVVDAQLESKWPVYGLAQHQGLVWAAAGRQDTVDGGIWIWGLDPATGAPKRRIVIATPPVTLPAGQKQRIRANDRGFLNSGLAVADGFLALRAPSLDKTGSSPARAGYFSSEYSQTRRSGFDKPPTVEPNASFLPIDTEKWNQRAVAVTDPGVADWIVTTMQTRMTRPRAGSIWHRYFKPAPPKPK
jgi:outer membrane protein assembly factor BamB